jgi:hypothetical protein
VAKQRGKSRAAKKGRARARVKIALQHAKKKKRRLRLPKSAAETFSFPSQLPQSEQSIFPKSELAAPQGEKLDLPVAPVIRMAEKKRQVPHAATAILGSLLATILLFAALIFFLGMGELYALSISMAIFVGIAILFYNHLEGRA